MPLYETGIAGIEVDDTDLEDGDFLQYDEASDTWKVVPGASLLGRAIFKNDGGLVYDSNGHPQIKVNQ